uniref:Uncharacterized protein n=1 Tax=Coccolithus braarudii TaxID=221442 RepID=A0A7S0PZT0_9EUKA|mmetsp:Transcript_31552/g.67857  ORF Transcript_31552/g.67857 Transcript_31552/m.67857 type:complete len:284 (+) Transcript_31552:66-917(+)
MVRCNEQAWHFRECECEAFVRKNHQGSRWRGNGRLRYCRIIGFQVLFFRQQADPTPCSGFDLRDVRCVRPTADGAAPEHAIDLLVSERSASLDKLIIIGVPSDARARREFLVHICSAVSEDCLVREMRSCRDPAIAERLERLGLKEVSIGPPPLRTPSLLASSRSMFRPRTPAASRRAKFAEGCKEDRSRTSPLRTPRPHGHPRPPTPHTRSGGRKLRLAIFAAARPTPAPAGASSPHRGHGLLEAVFDYAERRKLVAEPEVLLRPFPSAERKTATRSQDRRG